MTLLRETKAVIKELNLTVADIVFIGSADGKYECSLKTFEEIADFEYDAGYGSTEVALDLVIIFSDGSWIERDEYDGSEWWRHVCPNKGSSNTQPKEMTTIFGYDKYLEELN